jgi:signal transduction histidine kinase
MQNDLSILIWLANKADLMIISRLLTQYGLTFKACADIGAVVAACGQGAGTLLLEEEVLTTSSVLARLTACIDNQPPWSDLPVVLLARNNLEISGKFKHLPRLISNLTMVKRPIVSISLVSILQTALKDRQRQYQVRNLITQLQEEKVALEKRVQERTAQLKRSNTELEQFAYAVSHDLREPLRTISSFLELFRRRYHGEIDSKADSFINFAVDGARRLDEMINDLLEYSRVQREEIKLQPVELFDVWLAALKQVSKAIEESGVHVSHDPLPVVKGNESQLVRLFQNLINNAIKYRRMEVVPHVHISAEEQDEQCRIAVRDNGIGIPPDKQEYVFQVFSRLHNQKIPGTGIGLSTCKKIVELHGGRIWVESKPGEGSTFYFTLPKAESLVSSRNN